jgi:hypothetical protein
MYNLFVFIRRTVDVTIPHSGENVVVLFGSTLNKHPCEASFAVDDVIIYLK